MRRYINTKLVNVRLNKKFNYISSSEDKKKQHNTIRDDEALPTNNSPVSGKNEILPKNISTRLFSTDIYDSALFR
jgi:hypothetical protein